MLINSQIYIPNPDLSFMIQILLGQKEDQVKDSGWISANPLCLEKQLKVYVLLAMGQWFSLQIQKTRRVFCTSSWKQAKSYRVSRLITSID